VVRVLHYQYRPLSFCLKMFRRGVLHGRLRGHTPSSAGSVPRVLPYVAGTAEPFSDAVPPSSRREGGHLILSLSASWLLPAQDRRIVTRIVGLLRARKVRWKGRYCLAAIPAAEHDVQVHRNAQPEHEYAQGVRQVHPSRRVTENNDSPE